MTQEQLKAMLAYTRATRDTINRLRDLFRKYSDIKASPKSQALLKTQIEWQFIKLFRYDYAVAELIQNWRRDK